jgi:hypothetical protein
MDKLLRNEIKNKLLRFHRKVGGYWLFGNCSPASYGTLWNRGKTYTAHRMSYQIFNGPIPTGLLVMHKCDTPACINPEHLMTGNHVENAMDMVRKGRGAWDIIKARMKCKSPNWDKPRKRGKGQ